MARWWLASSPDSPASKAGLHAGDVLLSIEDKQITDTASMLNIIAALPPNKNATVKIFRNEAEKSVVVMIGKRPKPKVENE